MLVFLCGNSNVFLAYTILIFDGGGGGGGGGGGRSKVKISESCMISAYVALNGVPYRRRLSLFFFTKAFPNHLSILKSVRLYLLKMLEGACVLSVNG